MRKLIQAEARLDVQDWQGNSPVHIACKQGDLKAMAALLQTVPTGEGQEMTYEPEDLNRMNYTGELKVQLKVVCLLLFILSV